MKYLYAVLALFLTHYIVAQNKYPEPEFSNTPMWFDASSGNLRNFERMPVNQSARITGMASAETLVFFPGETAAVQFDVNKFPLILVKMNTPNEDPYGSIEIAKMQVNKRKQQREYILSKAGFGGAKSTINTIGIDFKRINSNGVYQIVPTNNLTSGEYVFSNSAKKAFLFSLVGDRKDSGSESIEGRTYEQYKQKQKEINENPLYTPEEKKRLTKEEHDRQSEMENRAFVKAREERNRRNDSIAAANSKIEESNSSTTPKTEPVKVSPTVKEETKITPPKPVYQEPIKEEPKVVVPASIETTSQPPARQVKVTYSRTEEIPAPKPAPVPVAPATKTVSDSGVEELIKWKKMLDAGVITQAEYEAKKKQVLGN